LHHERRASSPHGPDAQHEPLLPARYSAGFVRARLAQAECAAFTRQLQADLAEAARCHAITGAIIGELSHPAN